MLIADAISWFISLGSGTLFSLIRNRCLSAKLEHVVWAGAGLASFFWLRGGTDSHRLVGVGVGTDDVTAFSIDVVLAVDGVVGVSAGFGFGLGFSVGFGLRCLPACGCWRSSSSFGPPVCAKSACIKASRPTSLVSALFFSLCPRSVAATTIVIMSVMSLRGQ